MNEIEIYTAPDGKTELEVRFEGETVWLTQEQIAAVFGIQRPAITKHLKNVFASGELDEQVVSSILEHTTKHGAIAGKTQIKKVKFYNLDAIISIGYRVNSKQATTFRIWATQTLKNYLIQGYALNEKRLKQVSQNLQKLETVIKQIQNVGNSEELQLTEAKGLLEILGNYTKIFVLLSQ